LPLDLAIWLSTVLRPWGEEEGGSREKVKMSIGEEEENGMQVEGAEKEEGAVGLLRNQGPGTVKALIKQLRDKSLNSKLEVGGLKLLSRLRSWNQYLKKRSLCIWWYGSGEVGSGS
jgi:hypothetical protein